MISWHLFFGPAVHPMHILGHIFCFGWDLRIFTEVTCATTDDFMTFVLRTCRAPDAHTGAYFPFQMWFMVLRLCRVFDDKWFHVTRFLTCRASDAHIRAYFPFQMWFMVLHLCRMFDDRWFHVARFLTYHTFDAILRHITVLDEIYRSWRSCAFIPIYETYIETMIYLLSLRWFPRWSLSGVTQLGLHFLTLRCHPAFLPGGAPLIRGPDSVADMDDSSSFNFPICRVLMPHWGIFPISVEICRSPTDWHDRPQFWDTHWVDDSISSCPDTLWSLSRVFQPDSCFLI